MTAVIEAGELGKRYRSRWALNGCTLSVPLGASPGSSARTGPAKTSLAAP